MRLSLRAGEKIYMNGAVFSVDRRVSIELLNDVTFLLEAHVMQEAEATTPIRRIYFAIQLMLMDPTASQSFGAAVGQMVATLSAIPAYQPLVAPCLEMVATLEEGRTFEALKAVRAMFPVERKILAAQEAA